MKPIFALPAAAAVALLGLGVAVAQDTGRASDGKAGQGQQCFYSNLIRGVQPVGDRQVNVRVGVRDIYRIDLSSPCNGLRDPTRVINLSPAGGSGAICAPASLDLSVRSGGGFKEICLVDKITHLTSEEVASLPRRDTP